jgi:hypothetical protein
MGKKVVSSTQVKVSKGRPFVSFACNLVGDVLTRILLKGTNNNLIGGLLKNNSNEGVISL